MCQERVTLSFDWLTEQCKQGSPAEQEMVAFCPGSMMAPQTLPELCSYHSQAQLQRNMWKGGKGAHLQTWKNHEQPISERNSAKLILAPLKQWILIQKTDTCRAWWRVPLSASLWSTVGTGNCLSPRVRDPPGQHSET